MFGNNSRKHFDKYCFGIAHLTVSPKNGNSELEERPNISRKHAKRSSKEIEAHFSMRFKHTQAKRGSEELQIFHHTDDLRISEKIQQENIAKSSEVGFRMKSINLTKLRPNRCQLRKPRFANESSGQNIAASLDRTSFVYLATSYKSFDSVIFVGILGFQHLLGNIN